MTQERESGYYCVNFAAEWFIARYYSDIKIWELPGYKTTFCDEDFSQITETPIPLPETEDQ